MKVLLTMANNSSTPYFGRFAYLESKQKEIELEFLCLTKARPDMIEEMEGFEFTCHWLKYNKEKRKSQLILSFFKTLFFLLRHRPDVVHTHLFEDSLPVLCAAWLLRIKKRVISKLDAGYHWNYAPKWVKFDQLNNWLATDIVAVSEENKLHITENEEAKPQKVKRIFQGLLLEELDTVSRPEREVLIRDLQLENRKVILTVSRYIPWKGHEQIIDAAAKLSGDIPDIKFLFFGAGDHKERLIQIVKEKNLEDYIHVGDWVRRAELNELYRLADVYCNASLNEPFGFVIAEAMLMRVPLVTTNTGAAFDMINHLETGFLCDGSADELARGIQHFLKEDTSKITDKAYQLAEANFTANAMWEQHKALYRGKL